eukprot:scaffold78044_cov33-Phaeocystis_antarctica.AAC.1
MPLIVLARAARDGCAGSWARWLDRAARRELRAGHLPCVPHLWRKKDVSITSTNACCWLVLVPARRERLHRGAPGRAILLVEGLLGRVAPSGGARQGPIAGYVLQSAAPAGRYGRHGHGRRRQHWVRLVPGPTAADSRVWCAVPRGCGVPNEVLQELNGEGE